MARTITEENEKQNGPVQAGCEEALHEQSPLSGSVRNYPDGADRLLFAELILGKDSYGSLG